MIRILKIIIAAAAILGLTGWQFIHPPAMGVHIINRHRADYFWLVEPTWVRSLVRWSEVEATPGVYTWDATQDEIISGLHTTHNPLLLVINTTPEWARIHPQLRCSPPRPNYLDDFAAFVNAVIERYKPQAIELGNEPEVAHYQVGDYLDNFIGCWGPDGYYYAEMLKTVYPAVKAAHPETLIVAGSLMLQDSQLDFWPEVLATGGLGNYDILSYHAYTYYPINDFEIAFRKADYLRSIGETAPLWLTETSLLCSQYTKCEDEFEANQAEYLRYVFDRSLNSEISLLFWLALADNGWQHSDLVYRQRPKPAWYVYREIALQGYKRQQQANSLYP